MLRRDASAGGAASLSCLELVAAGNAAADFLYDFPEGGAHGDFHQAVCLILPPRANTLVPLDFSVPMEVNQSAPLRMNLGNIGVGFHVIEDSGLAEEALYSRERRTAPGLAALALDGGHQGRFLAAHKGAGAQTQLHVKTEIRVENILAQQAVFPGPGQWQSASA